jgi:hypothetical protein
MTTRGRFGWLALAWALGAGTGEARGEDLEAALNGRWRGAWVVVRVPLQSDCGGFYTDNELVGSSPRSRGARRFDGGELARVERVDLKRARLDLFLDLAEPVLWPVEDGPFTLYQERPCRVQLQAPQPRDVLADASRTGAAVERLLAAPHPTRAAAEADGEWNGRRREPYPEDYERTLAEHASWKASQANAAVERRLEESSTDALRMADRVGDDPEYLQGFAAGVAEARDRHLPSECGALLASRFEGFAASLPKGREEDWRRGFQDGQRLVYDLELLHRLPRCFVPVPPPPA